MRLDQFYTPHNLSQKMVDLALTDEPQYIADFAAGDGKLLSAAYHRWPQSTYIANDIDREETSKLSYNFPSWIIETCDFTSASARKESCYLHELQSKINLILLNPPFSNRGSKYYEVSLSDIKFKCGLALSFVLYSLSYLARGGEIIAILPESCFFSQRDEAAWDYINKIYRVDMISNNSRFAFEGCYPNTSIIHIIDNRTPHDPTQHLSTKQKSTLSKTIDVDLFRGNIQVPRIKLVHVKENISFVHSVSLQNGKVVIKDRVSSMYNTVSGPAVFIPRVGQPRVDKVALYLDSTPVALSDCVISFGCKTPKAAVDLYDLIVGNWGDLEYLYTGTGSRYVTVRALTAFLKSIGCNVTLRCKNPVEIK